MTQKKGADLLTRLQHILDQAQLSPTLGELLYVVKKELETVELLREALADKERELEAVYRLLNLRQKDQECCPHYPKGERCALPINHDGPCKWQSGD